MASFILRAVFDSATMAHGFNIADFAVASFQGQSVLYSASATDGGLSAFTLTANLPASLLSEMSGSAATGTYGVNDIEFTYIGGAPMILPAGRYDDSLSVIGLNSSGAFASASPINSVPQSTAALSEVEVMKFGVNTYVFAGQDNGAGIDVFNISTSSQTSYIGSLNDSVATTLANVSDLITFSNGTVNLLFAASSMEHGVTSIAINSAGGLNVVDVIDGLRGYGIYQATTLATAEAGAGDFLLVGASGSNNITVFEIGANGTLSYRDMVWDSLNTRFKGATAIETITLGERAFVIAGGSDGGVTLFELGPDGHLYFMSNLVDTATTTLSSISAIKAVDVAGDIQVFISSAKEDGITQFSLDLGSIGNLVTPTGTASNALGSPADDFLMGTDDANTLWGMQGSDRIVDGDGIDELYGGGGADVFVFVRDGMYDRIRDYQPGVDKIDLSGFDRIYSMSAFDIIPTVYGARIDLGADSIILETQNGQTLTAADFTSASFIFG